MYTNASYTVLALRYVCYIAVCLFGHYCKIYSLSKIYFSPIHLKVVYVVAKFIIHKLYVFHASDFSLKRLQPLRHCPIWCAKLPLAMSSTIQSLVISQKSYTCQNDRYNKKNLLWTCDIQYTLLLQTVLNFV